MEKTLGLGAVVVVAVAFVMTASPVQLFAAKSVGSKCGERANPTDPEGVTEHRIQSDGICVDGGAHSDWWLGTCVPENHQSAPCP